MGKMMIGSAMGLMAGVALMMSRMGKTLRRDMNRGMSKVKRMARKLERM